MKISDNQGVLELIKLLDQFEDKFNCLPANDKLILEECVTGGTTGKIDQLRRNLEDALNFD